MSIYPPVPELDWLDELMEDLSLIKRYAKNTPKLFYVYKYLLWHRRFHLAGAQTDKGLIAFGFALKYQRLLYGQKLTGQDKKTVEISEREYKNLKQKAKDNG